MKLAIIGYGKMGQIIRTIADARGHETVVIDPHYSEAYARQPDSSSLEGCDCAIHFTTPEAFRPTVESTIAAGCNLVVGTTGWYDQLGEIKKTVESSGSGFMYSPNFSIGVNAFFSIVKNAAELINAFDEYDIAATEYHHRHKEDSPSGTAKAITDILLQNIDRKEKAVFDRLDRAPRPEELHVASIRCGSIPGTHTVSFDSEADTITLQHTARNRNGFALGAVRAAEWMAGRSGFYSMEAFMEHTLSATR